MAAVTRARNLVGGWAGTRRRLLARTQRLLDTADVTEVQPQTFLGDGRLGRIGGGLGSRGGLLGEVRPLALTGREQPQPPAAAGPPDRP